MDLGADPVCRYDLSEVGSEIDEIKFDLKGIVGGKIDFQSQRYLKENGKPVIALSGRYSQLFSLFSSSAHHLLRPKLTLESSLPGLRFGGDSGHTPEFIRSIASFINEICPGGAYLIGGGKSRNHVYP